MEAQDFKFKTMVVEVKASSSPGPEVVPGLEPRSVGHRLVGRTSDPSRHDRGDASARIDLPRNGCDGEEPSLSVTDPAAASDSLTTPFLRSAISILTPIP